jgi:aldehyde dehydrogenase (NAD(P)+)
VVARVYPTTLIERLLLSGYRAEVWMDPSVRLDGLPSTTATFYDRIEPEGAVTVILGAGNIASIPPLDLLHKLYVEGSVTVMKMNPVNEYLGPIFEGIFEPLIEAGFVRFTYGGTDVGDYLVRHPSVDRIHITGSARTHDTIVFGSGPEGRQRKQRDEPVLDKPITSELGGVGPTIVVPGPWDEADYRFQAEHIATQKLHNSGFNCVASQVLVLPEGWEGSDLLLDEVRRRLAAAEARPPYYPGVASRDEAARASHPGHESLAGAHRTLIVGVDALDLHAHSFTKEFFGPTYATTTLPGRTPAAFLRAAVDFANTTLAGTLGANIIVHPSTAKEMGPALDRAIADLRYGTVAVNTWTALAFLLPRSAWGPFPGHTREDIGSGAGFVHNAVMFDKPQKNVVYGPFRPIPRALLKREWHLSPRPPWFVTNKTAHVTAERLTRYAADNKLRHLPGIFTSALRG